MTSQGTTGIASIINRIEGFAPNCWTAPSNMAAFGNIYDYDWQQNVTFPAQVTATGGFSGNLTGNVTGNATFLKCPDKRYSYPAQIVTSGGNIGAAFMTAAKLGLSDGNYYDAVILRGYTDSSGGNENALLFSKNSSSVYHSQYAFGSTTTWGTMYKFLDSGNYSSYALPLSGGTMTGNISWNADSHGIYLYRGCRIEKYEGYGPTLISEGNNTDFYIRNNTDRTKYYKIIHAGNYSEYALKINGTNGTADGVSTLLNKLTIGTATPVDADYYICQWAGGGTTTTYYHRRPMYAMYAYIKSKAASDFLPLSGGTLGSTSRTATELNIQSSTSKLRLLAYSDTTNYIQSGNAGFTDSANLTIAGIYGDTGSNLHLNFANIYCRAGRYTNIDSGNYSTYALPLSGGTLTGTLISRDVRPSANLSYSLGTSSYYYNYVYAKYFKKSGSSDSYVLLGGGGHKAVSDFAPNNVATLSSSGTGNSDQWTLVFEQSYPANYWYEPITMFYVKGGTVGCGILCFYNYWNSETKLNDYEKEVWFFGAQKSETSTTFGGANRDINNYLRIYIDKANFKYQMYYNRYNDRDLRIQELQFFVSPEAVHTNGSLRSSFFTNSTTVVNLPTESSTLIRVPIKTTYNHDRTIKTTKSIYASSFYENSDIRLKENVRGIDQSDLTKQVDLVQFNFKDSDTKKYGVIAQQLEQVGLQNLVYENDGKKAVDYISLLVLEIQRLRNEIGELKQEINKKS